jgi:hypothetical protein
LTAARLFLLYKAKLVRSKLQFARAIFVDEALVIGPELLDVRYRGGLCVEVVLAETEEKGE